MADVKWIKITTDIFDDEKILLIEALPESDAIIVIWFKLLCLAGKQNNGGVFMLNDRIPYTDEMLATIFRTPLTTLRLALNTFQDFGMIEIINDVITIPNWEKHQNIEGLERIKEQNRIRVANHRAKQKRLSDSNVTVTLRNATDKNREEEKRKEESNRGEGDAPSLEQVKSFFKEKALTNVKPELFYNYYEAQGWRLRGGLKLTDWKAKALEWDAHERRPKKNKFNDFEQSSTDYAALEARLTGM